MNSISIKLFLALFGLTSVILFATVGLAKWSFNYGFYDYLDSIEENRLQRIASELAIHYEDSGDRWADDIDGFFGKILAADLYRSEYAPLLATNNQILRAALSQSIEDELKELPNLSSQEIEELVTSMPLTGMGPPPSSLAQGDFVAPAMGPQPSPLVQGNFVAPGMGPPPPTRAQGNFTIPGMGPMGATLPVNIWQPNTPLEGGEPPRIGAQIGSPGGPLARQQIYVKQPTVLLNINGDRLAGTDLPPGQALFMSQAVTVGGVSVGELRTVLGREFRTPLETAFSAQQKLASVSIIALSLLLAAIASWALSRMMLAPIVKLKDGIAELANGDYEQELMVDRQDELGMLMRDVNKLGSKLLKNRTSRRGWLADVSHELRTPVTILSGEIEAIKDGVRELDIGSVESLDHEVNRMKHLIDDLYQLSLSDIGGLRYVFERLDLGELLASIAGQHGPRIEAAGLMLDYKTSQGSWVQADKARLEQLFTNLINNSVAYTDAPGQIEISLAANPDNIVVRIEDSAPSVDEKYLSVMFEPLFREEKSRNRRKGGAGLGLTICRNIVIAHDATIDASLSKLGGMVIEIKFSHA